MSISTEDIFPRLEFSLVKLCDKLMNDKEIHNYKIIKPDLSRKRSGGIKLYRLSSKGTKYKVSGIDISVKQLDNCVVFLNESIPIFKFERMLSDKLKVLYSDKVFRRIKDIFDSVILIQRIDLDLVRLKEFCKINGVNFKSKENVFNYYENGELNNLWNKFITDYNVKTNKVLDENITVLESFIKRCDLIE